MALPPGYLAILAAAEQMSIKLTKDEAYFLERVMSDRGWVIVAHWQVDESKRHPGLIVEEQVTDPELEPDIEHGWFTPPDQTPKIMDAVDVLGELAIMIKRHQAFAKAIMLQVDGNARKIVGVGYDDLTDSIVIDAESSDG